MDIYAEHLRRKPRLTSNLFQHLLDAANSQVLCRIMVLLLFSLSEYIARVYRQVDLLKAFVLR
mgnify:CR=1 FL=1